MTVDHGRGKLRMGDILVERGVITPEQLQAALKQPNLELRRLGVVLVALGFATEDDITKAVSERLGISYFTSFEGLLDREVASLVPEAMARKLLIVPVLRTEDTLSVGMVNPSDTDAIDEVARLSGLHVQPIMTTLANLFDSIQQVYGHETVAPPLPDKGAKDKPEAAQSGDTVIDLVNGLLQEGLARRASDIHCEAAGKLVRVRYRIDGMLHDGATYPKNMDAAIVASKDNTAEKKVVATNRKARQFYEILDVVEAGLQLFGGEVKSLRGGQASLDGCYARPNDKGELFLHNFYIPPYIFQTLLEPLDTRRNRKLLLHSAEIRKILGKLTTKGLTLIPLEVYFKNGWAKVSLGLAKGKTGADRRDSLKKKDMRREAEKSFKGIYRG